MHQKVDHQDISQLVKDGINMLPLGEFVNGNHKVLISLMDLHKGSCDSNDNPVKQCPMLQ
jgi:hypothetical protein